jgi:WD40 repeat protein
VCFSPDGKALAVSLMARDAERGIQVRALLVDVATGTERLRLVFKSGVGTLAFSPDGKSLAITTGGDPGVRLWDVATGKPIRDLKGEKYRLAFSRDGRLLASAGTDRIVLTNVTTGEEIGRLEAKMDVVMSLAFTPDWKTLVAGCQDGKVRLWDVPTQRLRLQLDARMWMIRDMALSPDGKTVAVGAVYNAIRLWDVATGKELFTEHQGHDARVNSVTFSPDGKALASGGDNQQVRLWDPATGKQFRRLPVGARVVAFSPDGKRLGSVWTRNNTARLWDAATGEEVLRLVHEGVNTADWDTLRWLVFSPNGRSVLTLDHKHSQPGRSTGPARLHVWDAATGRHVREFRIPGTTPEGMALAPDGRAVALGGSEGTALQVWDLEAGRLIRDFLGHRQAVLTVAFSTDGRTLASGGRDQTVRLWEVATGKPIRTLQGHDRSVTAVAFSPGGRFLASGSGATDGELVSARAGPGQDKIRIWDVATGAEVFHFHGHESNVTSLAFAPDGFRLACGLRNTSVLLWDTSPLARRQPRGAKDLPAAELDRLWTDLAAADAARAYEAIGRLAAVPGKAVALLAARLQPAAAADAKWVRRLITDLDSDQFAVREAASRELETLGDQVEAALGRAVAGNPALETRRRLESLMVSLQTLRSPELTRQVRAAQVLEQIGTPEARQVLRILTGGAPEARLTREAKAALFRLEKQPTARP